MCRRREHLVFGIFKEQYHHEENILRRLGMGIGFFCMERGKRAGQQAQSLPCRIALDSEKCRGRGQERRYLSVDAGQS